MHVYDQFKLRNLRNLEIDVSALYVIARAIDAGASRSMTAIRASKPVAVALQASSLR